MNWKADVRQNPLTYSLITMWNTHVEAIEVNNIYIIVVRKSGKFRTSKSHHKHSWKRNVLGNLHPPNTSAALTQNLSRHNLKNGLRLPKISWIVMVKICKVDKLG